MTNRTVVVLASKFMRMIWVPLLIKMKKPWKISVPTISWINETFISIDRTCPVIETPYWNPVMKWLYVNCLTNFPLASMGRTSNRLLRNKAMSSMRSSQ